MTEDRLEVLLQFHAEDPSDAFTRFALAQEYVKRGRSLKACELYESLIEMRPAYTGTYYHLGKLYQSLDRMEDAARTFRSGIAACSQKRDAKDLSELKQALRALCDEE